MLLSKTVSMILNLGPLQTGFIQYKYFYTRTRNLRWKSLIHRGKLVRISLKLKSLFLDVKKNPLMYVNPMDQGLSRDLFIYGFREPYNTVMVYFLVKKLAPTVVDIGSNIGYFPLIEFAAGARRIVAIEPVNLNFKILKLNMRSNNLSNVRLINGAVSDRSGTATIYIRENLNLSSLSQEHFLNKRIIRVQKIRTYSLSEVVDSYEKVMLRMDVEGHEYKILTQIPDNVIAISMELHANKPYSLSDARELLKKLIDLNFTKIFETKNISYLILPNRGWNYIHKTMLVGNWLKVHNDVESVLESLKENKYFSAHLHLIRS